MGELLNRDPRVMYFYEPCRALEWVWGLSPDTPRLHAACAELTIQLLTCNVTEPKLRMLLGDKRAVSHDRMFQGIADSLQPTSGTTH